MPKKYLVTLAGVDLKELDLVVWTYVAGQPRTVTREKGGRFTET